MKYQLIADWVLSDILKGVPTIQSSDFPISLSITRAGNNFSLPSEKRKFCI